MLAKAPTSALARETTAASMIHPFSHCRHLTVTKVAILSPLGQVCERVYPTPTTQTSVGTVYVHVRRRVWRHYATARRTYTRVCIHTCPVTAHEQSPFERVPSEKPCHSAGYRLLSEGCHSVSGRTLQCRWRQSPNRSDRARDKV